MNDPLPLAADPSPRRSWGLALLIAVTLFAAIAPTLNWLEFSGGNENIVTQTALEMRHGGPVLVPRMMGEPRVKKPPLVAWITAAAMRPDTLAKLSDLKLRDQAYIDLAFQVRWTALLAACVLTLAAFEIGRVWGGGLVGVMTALAVCTNYLFLKYMRQSTSDAHLATWVIVANACFAHGLLRGRWWPAATGGALATGLAFLCKGPVALAETVLPTIVMAIVLHAGNRSAKSERPTRWRWPAVVGVVLFLLVAVPWFWHVWRTVPGVATTWKTEVGREGATDLQPSNPVIYLELGALTAPWLVFGLVGLIVLWQRRRERAAWLPGVYAVVPLLVMVWFRDRKERYMLPMIGPAAVICGYGAAVWIRSWHGRRNWADYAVAIGHGVVLFGAGVALLVGGRQMQRLDGRPWFSPSFVTWGAVALAAFAGLTILATRRRAWALPAATFVAMLAMLAIYTHGYRDSKHGRSPLKAMAEKILTEAPGAAVYDWLPRGRVDEQLPLYLNHTVLRADPATLTPIDRPIVVVSKQGKSDPVPDFGPQWQVLDSAKEGAVNWFAFVRRPGDAVNATALALVPLPSREGLGEGPFAVFPRSLFWPSADAPLLRLNPSPYPLPQGEGERFRRPGRRRGGLLLLSRACLRTGFFRR